MKNKPFAKFFASKAPVPPEISTSERSVTQTHTTVTEDGDIVINVVGVPETTRPWVYSDKRPVHPMPSEKGISYEQLPLCSAVSPKSWFFRDCFNTRNGLILDISEENKVSYPIAYGKEALGVKKVYIGLDDSGILTSMIWGYTDNCPFEVAFMTDVCTVFSDCILTTGKGALSTNLADVSYIYDHLKSTILMTRVAYGLSSAGAEDVFDILLCEVSSAIASTSAKIFNELLQPELVRLKAYLAEKDSFINELNNELDMIICQAIRKADNSDQFVEVQQVLEKYSELSAIIKSTVKTFLQLNQLNQQYSLQLNLGFITEIYSRNNQLYQRIMSTFELMR